jgi:chromosomal replication initiator protein
MEQISFLLVVSAVCRYYDITEEQLKERTRSPRIVEARHICIYLLTENKCMHQSAIARYFQMHHTSMIHACERVQNEIDVYPLFRARVERIRNQISLLHVPAIPVCVFASQK